MRKRPSKSSADGQARAWRRPAHSATREEQLRSGRCQRQRETQRGRFGPDVSRIPFYNFSSCSPLPRLRSVVLSRCAAATSKQSELAPGCRFVARGTREITQTPRVRHGSGESTCGRCRLNARNAAVGARNRRKRALEPILHLRTNSCASRRRHRSDRFQRSQTNFSRSERASAFRSNARNGAGQML